MCPRYIKQKTLRKFQLLKIENVQTDQTRRRDIIIDTPTVSIATFLEHFVSKP
jgi:hypothetical protein